MEDLMVMMILVLDGDYGLQVGNDGGGGGGDGGGEVVHSLLE